MGSIYFSSVAVFGIIFAVTGAEFTTSYLFIILAAIIGVIIGLALGVNIAPFIVDKIPDFKSCKIIINSNNEVIVQIRSRNALENFCNFD